MSGVVLSSSDADDRLEEDDDVAGLLDDDDLDDDGEGSGLTGLGGSRRYRGGVEAGLRRPYAAVRSVGTLGHLLNTLMLCLVFFALVGLYCHQIVV